MFRTADERILHKRRLGLYYRRRNDRFHTDSVIGMGKEFVLERFIKQMPVRFEVATEAVELQGVLR